MTASAYYFKHAVDQGLAVAQYKYELQLVNGDGISVIKSQSAYYFKLAADQR
jgi:TPR repeat protein